MPGFFPILRCLEVYDKTGVAYGCRKRHTIASVAVGSWHDAEKRVGETERPVHSLRTITEETVTHVLVALARREPVPDYKHSVGTR